MSVTTDDILEALRGATRQTPSSGPEGMTSSELVAALHIPLQRLRRYIRQGIEAGRIEMVRVLRRDLADRVVPVPGYRLRVEA